MSDRNIAALDGIRGFAAATVFVSHIGLYGYAPTLKGLGQLGVMLFFVLSGFLMGLLYGGRARGPSDWVVYGLKRFFRVYPLFAVCCIAYYLLMAADVSWTIRVAEDRLIDHLLLNYGEGVLWTIPVEMKFYALFPLVAFVVCAAPKGLRWLALLATIAFFYVAPFPSNKFGVWNYVNVFLYGVLAAELTRMPIGERAARYADAICVAGFVGMFLMIPAVSTYLFDANSTSGGIPRLQGFRTS